jgi:hypothetical protein
MNREVWERASTEGMALTLAYVVTCLEQCVDQPRPERLSPGALLSMIEEKLRSYEPPRPSSVRRVTEGVGA